jgi:ABC-type uncharacterized transport system permease subunit
MLALITGFTIFAYSLAGLLQGAYLLKPRIHYHRFSIAIVLIAALLHSYLLYQWIDMSQGQNLAFFNVLSQVVWLSVVLLLVLLIFKPMANLGAVLFPLSAVTILLDVFFPGYHVLYTGTHSMELLHILLAFLAMSVLCIAVVQALLLTLQEYLLKRKRFFILAQALPSLETMEHLLVQMLSLGFLLLTLVLLTAVAFFNQVFSAVMWQHTLLALLGWLVFAVLLWGYAWLGWRGQAFIRSTLVGSGIWLLIAFSSYIVTI